MSSDIYSFTMTGDVGAVDPALLSTGTLQEQLCKFQHIFLIVFDLELNLITGTGTTDYIIIPDPSQNNALLTSGSDRFCGLGLTATTSKRSSVNFTKFNIRFLIDFIIFSVITHLNR